jgi:hypothetical protein
MTDIAILSERTIATRTADIRETRPDSLQKRESTLFKIILILDYFLELLSVTLISITLPDMANLVSTTQRRREDIPSEPLPSIIDENIVACSNEMVTVRVVSVKQS